MRLLVTAGGTREPIDPVRVIANTSTGRLGARFVDEAVDAGHEVLLLHAATAALPSRRQRRADRRPPRPQRLRRPLLRASIS